MIDFTPAPKPIKAAKSQKRYMTTKRHKPPASEADKRHLMAVKGLPCCICGSLVGVEAHHCISGRWGAHKPDHRKTIPLCKFCHRLGPTAIHNGKKPWQERNGLDTDYIPQTLRLIYG